MKYVIIGGVAGGATTAARLRRIDEHGEIVIFERGQHISYANCGLPHYIGETIPEREHLFVQTPEIFKSTLNIDVRVRTEVIRINREECTVTVKNLDPRQTSSWTSGGRKFPATGFVTFPTCTHSALIAWRYDPTSQGLPSYLTPSAAYSENC